MPATTPASSARLRRPCCGCVERAEADGVHRGDGARAHREDVAEDAADAGGRALKRLDEGGVVVRLDLEGGAPAVADVHDAGVLARRDDDALARRRKSLEVYARRLVRAVLRPHHGEDAELDEGRLAPEQLLDALELFRREVVCGDYFRGDCFRVHGEKRRRPCSDCWADRRTAQDKGWRRFLQTARSRRRRRQSISPRRKPWGQMPLS